MTAAVARAGLILLALLGPQMPLAAQSAPDRPDPVHSRSVLRPAKTDAVEVRHSTYRGADGAVLEADVYFDRTRTGPRPVLIMSAGTGDPRAWGGFKDLATVAAERGFAAILPMRRFPRGADGIRSGRADTLALIQQLPQIAAGIIDARRACLWAFSGGGTSLSLVYGPEKPALSCAIGFYPAVSLSSFSDDADWLATYSPAHALARNGGAQSPPMLIVRAGKDTAQLNAMIQLFVTASLERNAPIELINLPDAQHGFDWFDDTDWARQAIEDSFDFARRHTASAQP